MNTDAMRVKYDPGGRHPWDIERETLEAGERSARTTAETREIEKRIALTTEGIKNLERKLAEETFGFNVSSARALAQIQNQEVDINEIRKILMNLDIPEKEALAKWFDTVGSASPMAKATMSISMWLKNIFGGR